MNDISYRIYKDEITMDQSKDFYDENINSIFMIKPKEDEVLFILLNAKRLNSKNVFIPVSYELKKEEFINSLDNALFAFNYYITKEK
jgi:hypothetical protein